MQTATSETESKSRDLSICVHHYTLRAPCPKGQGNIKRRREVGSPRDEIANAAMCPDCAIPYKNQTPP